MDAEITRDLGCLKCANRNKLMFQAHLVTFTGALSPELMLFFFHGPGPFLTEETLELLIYLFLEFHYPGTFLLHPSSSLPSGCLRHAQLCFCWAKASGRCSIVCPSFPAFLFPFVPPCLPVLFPSTLDILHNV